VAEVQIFIVFLALECVMLHEMHQQSSSCTSPKLLKTLFPVQWLRLPSKMYHRAAADRQLVITLMFPDYNGTSAF